MHDAGRWNSPEDQKVSLLVCQGSLLCQHEENMKLAIPRKNKKRELEAVSSTWTQELARGNVERGPRFPSRAVPRLNGFVPPQDSETVLVSMKLLIHFTPFPTRWLTSSDWPPKKQQVATVFCLFAVLFSKIGSYGSLFLS